MSAASTVRNVASKPLTDEPALTVGAAVTAALVLLKSFGVDITPDQNEAILFAAPIVAALIIRFLVWSKKGLARVMPEHDGAGPAPGDFADEPGDHRLGKPIEPIEAIED